MLTTWLAAALGATETSVAAHALYQAATRRRFPAEGEMFVARGMRLHALRRGSGPAVVLIHGANASHHAFSSELIDDLARTHTVLALDRPGHAHSPRGAGTHDLALNARAVLALIEAAGVGPAVLVGHSYGTPVALRAALDEPALVRGVVAVAPAFVVDARNAAWARISALRPLTVLGGWTLSLPIAITLAPRVRRDAWFPVKPPSGWDASRAFPFTPAQMRAATDNLRHMPRDLARLHADLPRLAAPLAILAAEQDRITPWQPHAGALHAAVPGSRLTCVPATGHWLFRQRPELVAEAVRAISARGVATIPW